MAANSVADLHARVLRLLNAQLDMLETSISATGRFDEGLADMSTNLARSIATLTAEVRKREQHNKKITDSMSDDEREKLVFAFVRLLPDDRREKLRAILDEIDSRGKGVL